MNILAPCCLEGADRHALYWQSKLIYRVIVQEGTAVYLWSFSHWTYRANNALKLLIKISTAKCKYYGLCKHSDACLFRKKEILLAASCLKEMLQIKECSYQGGTQGPCFSRHFSSHRCQSLHTLRSPETYRPRLALIPLHSLFEDTLLKK